MKMDGPNGLLKAKGGQGEKKIEGKKRKKSKVKREGRALWEKKREYLEEHGLGVEKKQRLDREKDPQFPKERKV